MAYKRRSNKRRRRSNKRIRSNNRRRSNHRRSKKVMYGCSSYGCGTSCPIAPLSVSDMNKFGGSNLPIPGPIIGKPWAPTHLPGQNGIGGDNNYLSSYANKLDMDPQQQTSMNDSGYLTNNSLVGGYTYSNTPVHGSSEITSDSNEFKKKKRKKGYSKGGFLPQDLVNVGQNASYMVNSAYNAFNGYPAPTNPLPYKDQLHMPLRNV